MEVGEHPSNNVDAGAPARNLCSATVFMIANKSAAEGRIHVV
jgi:hypothetical protein